MTSLTVRPLMIDSSNGMVYSRPAAHAGSNTVSRYGVPRSAHRNSAAGGHLGGMRLARGRGVPAGPAGEQPVRVEQLATRRDGLALRDQDHVVDRGLRHERRDDARPDAGNVAPARGVAEDDGALRIDGDDPDGRGALLEPTRPAGRRS